MSINESYAQSDEGISEDVDSNKEAIYYWIGKDYTNNVENILFFLNKYFN
jgi:hypothetical protein